MSKDKWIEIAIIAGCILGLCVILLMGGCKSAQQIKYYESGQISEVLYSSEFNPQWSPKEGIIKTGNIGISL